MMSEHQFRKTTVSRDHIQRPTNNLVKAGDMAAEKTPARLKSKNTLPKNLRYDLENALVGLCDVWFEDIKPYLERNNIKVHVHEPVEGNGQGDSARGTGAPNCAHLHPASSAPRCELCRLLFNAANSIESAVSQAACVSACGASPDQTRNTK
nr:uncharacterized protein LOC117995155 [Maniola hyperantus]